MARWWQHINTTGANTDPCVCGLKEELWNDEEKWPHNTGHCQSLLQNINDLKSQGAIEGRREWCSWPRKDQLGAVGHFLESDVTEKPPPDLMKKDFPEDRPPTDTNTGNSSRLWYSKHYLRMDMGLKPLTIETLAEMLTIHIFWVRPPPGD